MKPRGVLSTVEGSLMRERATDWNHAAFSRLWRVRSLFAGPHTRPRGSERATDVSHRRDRGVRSGGTRVGRLAGECERTLNSEPSEA